MNSQQTREPKRVGQLIIFIIIAFVLVILITAAADARYQPSASPTGAYPSGTQVSSSTPVTPTTGKTYAMSEIAQHNSSANCWTSVYGNVYDVTTWISNHPGGRQAVIDMCGVDGTAAFAGQHDGQRRATNELATFKIGTLAQ